MTRVKKMCIILPLWGIAKSVKAQDFDSCISLVRVQLPQPKQKGPHQRSFLFWLIDGRTRKAGPEKAMNGLFPAVAFPQKSESNGWQAQKQAEISRDFSAFFDSKVFRNFVDAFRAFRVCRQIRTSEMHFLI